jgi:hypothetical protein
MYFAANPERVIRQIVGEAVSRARLKSGATTLAGSIVLDAPRFSPYQRCLTLTVVPDQLDG